MAKASASNAASRERIGEPACCATCVSRGISTLTTNLSMRERNQSAGSEEAACVNGRAHSRDLAVIGFMLNRGKIADGY